MKVKYSRCTSSNLNNVPIVDGQIVFVKDTQEQYIDTSTKRSKITDLHFVPDLETLHSIKDPMVNKLYYVVSENTIQHHNGGEWQEVGNAKIDLENILTKDNETPYTPTKDYHPATKKYVDDSIKGAEETSYYKTLFTNNDWVLNGQQYQLTITQAQHRLSNPYVLSLEMLEESQYKTVSIYGSKLLPNGNILIISDLAYEGRLLLKGGI